MRKINIRSLEMERDSLKNSVKSLHRRVKALESLASAQASNVKSLNMERENLREENTTLANRLHQSHNETLRVEIELGKASREKAALLASLILATEKLATISREGYEIRSMFPVFNAVNPMKGS